MKWRLAPSKIGNIFSLCCHIAFSGCSRVLRFYTTSLTVVLGVLMGQGGSCTKYENNPTLVIILFLWGTSF